MGIKRRKNNMKFVVYEVKRIRREEKDDYVDTYLYADYADAVVKFNELVEEEKQIDWIEEDLKNQTGEVFDTIDYWGIAVENGFDSYVSEVIIETREVF
jgi:hypothetical protein